MKLKFCFCFEKSIRIRATFYKVDSKQTHSSNNSMQSNSFFLDNRKMARARDDECCEFRIMHQIKFESLILGHHVYKNVWSPYKRVTLIALPNNRDEAQEDDKYAVGIFEKNDDGSKELVGHAPVEFSSLLYHFLQASAENCINVEVIGKRKCEVGLVVPAKYNAFTRNKKIAMVLDEELAKRKKLYRSCLELKHQWENIYRMFPVYQ